MLDIDAKNGSDGFATLRSLGFDPDAMSPVMVRSPSGGRHLFFSYDPDCGDSIGKLGAGLDTKGHANGSYVVAPGSLKGDRRYEPLGAPLGSVELPPYPAALRPPRPAKGDPVPPESDVTEAQREAALARLQAAVETLAATPKGTRDQAVYNTARLAGGIGAHGRAGARITAKGDAWALFKGACFEAFELDSREQRHMAKTFGNGWRSGLEAPVDLDRELDLDELDDLGEPEDNPIDRDPDTPKPAEPLFASVAAWEGQPSRPADGSSTAGCRWESSPRFTATAALGSRCSPFSWPLRRPPAAHGAGSR